ncbi:DUF3560 domain-containing protein [Kribbella sp. NBC_00889]|uniref:DUF3560 domain-containing protein n=1 Tax=Kribbella sp. NBC_00889 TaxID=2975974 RepID=UPI003863A510|nr:DUF3560 domain-containing protein [Kribbella sp. NBC_00889]
MTAQIEIVHTHADGSLVSGTRRGDGSAEMLKANNWRWSRQLELWYLPRSRDQLAKTNILMATQDALSAAGFEVSVEIDDAESRPVEERETDRATRAQARSELLRNRALRRRESADASWDASRQVADGIPLGQPILVGHHSEPRHRRDLERIQSLAGKSVEQTRAAEADERRADVLSGEAERRYSVKAVGRRITRLGTELRRVERELGGYSRVVGGYSTIHPPATGDRAERLGLQRIDLQDQLKYWTGVRDELAADQPTYSHETINKGDYVRISGHWRKVARVNRKSVSVETGYSWTDRAPYYDITEHRPAEDVDGPGL